MVQRIGRWLRKYFLTGLLVLLPLIVTLYLFILAYNVADTLLGSVVNWIVGRPIPGAELVLMVVLILGVGAVATNVFGRKLIGWAERVFQRIPLVSTIYSAIKQIVDAFTASNQRAFERVVLIEYPRKGIYSIGFLTSEGFGEVQTRTEEHVLSVFVPTTPNPTSGFLLLVPQDQVTFLEMTVEQAFKFIISGGMVVPPFTTGGHE